MFMGTYQHTLDSKNRLIIPAKFRNQLGSGFVITKGNEHSLHAYSQAGWETYQSKLNQLPSNNAKVRQFKRIILAGATEVEFDKQGRIVLPNNLKEHALLQKSITIIGYGDDEFEIWDTERFEQYNADVTDNFDDISNELAELGFDI
ncbi:division/cell wall cluster transcriptional repressor MraZ [Weissella koreensis]|uniref:Transcriptional regulator MraZ n=1 Tax=Weissella koreensis TaxID=165096 RepID=A0A7H1MKJ1_9LACO|nr:division/cell wall cluster transcriptional repressor MraZ [Weissella koreensis]AVH74774.1 transcriptional regulator MraZ [Weissella koreensis]EJF33679.1 cell division protein MraZ [Weissella koreensis KCTC 3621]EJF34081.1 cell division protein MraZ [Weissella koreensis KCTC 3621]MCZ9310569.1 division/cell wall cluster transcriptional repressor MraZ [Weissella koreensis]QGN19999.1 division/cell wall cluster transcriptional repressor MraZ [Weissella koreensis]